MRLSPEDLLRHGACCRCDKPLDGLHFATVVDHVPALGPLLVQVHHACLVPGDDVRETYAPSGAGHCLRCGAEIVPFVVHDCNA